MSIILDEVPENLALQPFRTLAFDGQLPISLESPIGEEEDSHLGDFIEDRNALPPVDAASKQLLKEQIDDVLSTLTPREQRVLQLRFGLEDGRSRTLEEVGRIFKVTRERVRQVEAKAIRKIKNMRELCLDCQLEQADADLLKAMNRVEEIKQKIKEKENESRINTKN